MDVKPGQFVYLVTGNERQRVCVIAIIGPVECRVEILTGPHAGIQVDVEKSRLRAD